ncbi:MAG: SAM-dependent methyltransferase [Gemmataceae bacterium]
MNLSDNQLARLANPTFPRASVFDPEFQFDVMMGPNVLWLTEWLCAALDLRPGMRVLDLGCGKAASSIFLAKVFGVTVWAADLWVSPGQNLARIAKAGLLDRVFPVQIEAHALPFAESYFDVILACDAYHYFGTDDLYAGYIHKFLADKGRLAIVVPGLQSELDGDPPEHLRPYWDWQFGSFHTPEWWRRHWSKTDRLDVEVADSLPDGWRHWADWSELCGEVGAGRNPEGGKREAEMLRVDAGRTFGFTRVVASRR